AVLTSDAPDLVSHVAVRARNVGILFATCFDAEEYQHLKARAGETLSLLVTPAGDVETAEAAVGCADAGGPPRPARGPPPEAPPTTATAWVIGQDQFAPGIVGGKANNLNGLRGRLPDWVRLPKSIALPFGVLDKVLADERNRGLRDKCESLIVAAEEN